MRYRILRHGIPIGDAELQPSETLETPEEVVFPEAPDVIPGLLVGALEPSAGYEEIRALCQEATRTLLESQEDGDDHALSAPFVTMMEELTALGLTLETADGGGVPTRYVIVQDFGGLADVEPGDALIVVTAMPSDAAWPPAAPTMPHDH